MRDQRERVNPKRARLAAGGAELAQRFVESAHAENDEHREGWQQRRCRRSSG